MPLRQGDAKGLSQSGNWFANHLPLFLALLVLVILVPAAYFLTLKPQGAEAGWFNDSWLYRKPVAITNTGSDQTDFQINLSIGTSALVNAGKMQSDCDDIRITDINGNLLPYWIEKLSASACNTSTTKIWVKTSSIPPSGSILYIYYGNPSASSYQNGKDTFLYFDNFDDNNLDTSMWTKTDSYSEISETTNKLVFTGDAGGSWDQGAYLAPAITRDNTAMEFDYQWTSNNPSYDAFMFGWKDDGAGVSYTNLVYAYYNKSSTSCTTCAVEIYEDGTPRSGPTGDWVQNTNYKVQVRMKSGGGAYYKQSSDGGINWTTSYDSSYSTESNLHPGWMLHSGTHNIDNFFVRKSASTEPLAGTPGTEEESEGPVAYWAFDEGYGTTANDSTLNNNDGTFGTGSSAPTWQSEDMCVNGKCLKFDGNDKLSVTGNSSNNPAQFTMGAWVKINQFNLTTGNIGSVILTNYGGAAKGLIFYIYDDGRIGARVHDGGSSDDLKSINPISLNEWSYIVTTYDGTNLKVFINGKQENSRTASNNTNNNTVWVGSWGGVAQTNGSIDEVKIYPYARTAAQIKMDYASRGSVKGISARLSGSGYDSPGVASTLSNGLVGYWKMDAGVGTSAADFSGNNNIGTFGTGNSAPGWTSGMYGTGLSFDSNDYVDSNYKPPTSAKTLSYWVKYDSLSSVALTGVFETNKRFYSGVNSVSYYWGVGTTYKNSTNHDISTGTWYYTTITFDGTQAKYYINGEEVDSMATSQSSQTQYNFYIGKYNNGGVVGGR